MDESRPAANDSPNSACQDSAFASPEAWSGPLEDCSKADLVRMLQHHRMLLANQGEGIGIVDLQDRFVFVNPAAEKIFGLPEAGLVGRSLAEFLDESGLQAVASENQRRKRGATSRYELKIVRPDGQPRWISVTAVPRRDEQHQVIGVYGIFRDVTDQLRFELTLRESEETLRAIIESTADGILVVDRDWRLIHANQRLADMWDAPAKWMEPAAGEQLILHAARQVKNPAAFLRQLRSTASVPGESVDSLEFLDGRVFEVYSRPLARGQEAVGRVWSFRDITELKRAEEAARREYAKVAAMISGMDEGILFVDGSDRIVEVNDYFCRIMHLEQEQLLGMPISAFSSHEIMGVLIECSQQIQRGDLIGTVVRQRPLGPAEVLLRIQPIDQDGRYDGVLLNVINVTELVRARREAEQANIAKGEFLANMSHEIRTPLNGVIGITELALRSELSEELADQLHMIKSSADALMTLVNDVLDFSKVEAGKVELRLVEFSLAALLAEAVEVLTLKAREKGLDLSVRIAPGVPGRLVGDSMRLRQVLVNLIGNAVKFTEVGQIVLGVGVVDGNQDEVSLRFSVADSGIGIPAERHDAIFDAFAQADGSTTRRFGGTGLGLAISTRLVELMGGRLRVDSQVGRGSTFWFVARFPRGASLAAEDADAHWARPDTKSKLKPIERSSKGLTVLIAEDNPINQRVAVSMLEQRGHQVVVVDNGLAAVEATAIQHFDAVLMDVQMPRLDGLEAVRRIRAREKNTGGALRIVAMTAHAMPGDRARCLEAGMDGYLAKPFRPDDLYAAVELGGGAGPPAPYGPAVEASLPQESNAGVLNRDELVSRTRGDNQLVRELVRIFRATAPQLIEQMRTCLGKDDSDGLFRAAHSLKGAASMMAAVGVQGAAYRVEMIGRQGRLAEAGPAIDELEVASQQLAPVLDELEKGS